MSDKREVFTILEDDGTGEGVKLPARAQGDAAGGNHAPVVDAKDSSGNYILHEKREEGEAAADVSSMPSLTGKDLAGNLQFLNLREIGDTVDNVDAVIAMVAQDKEGLFAQLHVQADDTAHSGQKALLTLNAVDAAGNMQYIELRDQGEAASGVSDVAPVLPVKDLAGNLQYINARDEGDAVSGVDALPSLVAKDPSGNFKYLQTNSDGELIVSFEGSGTPLSSTAIVTPSAINTLTTIVEVTLGVDKIVEEIKVRGSCMFPTKWELIQVDDATLTVKDSFLSGPGQYSFSMHYANMEIATGASGTQKLRVRATQLSGAASDQHAYVECFQKP